MIPARHPSTTRSLGAPSDWDEDRSGRCSALPVADVEVEGEPYMESLWEPTPEELGALDMGEKVILRIRGRAHPVVSVAVTAPQPETEGMNPVARHNALAPALLLRLLTETPKESDALTVLESVLFGFMLRHRPDPLAATLMLAELNGRVVARLVEEKARKG